VRILLFILLGVAAAVVMLLIVGLLLPRRRAVSSRVRVAAPAARIYPLLADLGAGWQQWSPVLRTDGVEVEVGQRLAGAGASLTWNGKAGSGALTLTAVEPERSVDYDMQMGFAGITAHGRLELADDGGATAVTWTDEIQVGGNPLLRWMAWAMEGMRRKNLDQGLSAIESAAEAGER